MEKFDKKKTFWHINREMLPYKLHFLLFELGVGAVIPFQSAFAITVLGLTASNIAACYTALQVTSFLLKPCIGYIADYFNRLKTVIVGLAILQVVFSLFMIITPNTNMPGIDTPQLLNTSQNDTYCQLCLYSDAFRQRPPKEYVNEENVIGASSCFINNITENMLIDCSSEYTSSNYSRNDSFEMKLTICNSPFIGSFTSEIYDVVDGIQPNEDILEVLQIKSSQIYSICFFPAGKIFYHINFSSGNMDQYCYLLSNESIWDLPQMHAKPNAKTIDCSGRHKSSASQQINERNISIANFKTYQFWAFAVCLLAAATCSSAEFTMSDTACYESIQGHDYGQQKVWGAIGWGFIGPVAGYLIDYTQSFMASWCLFAFFTALQIWNLSRMNLVKPDISKSILKDIRTIFSSMEFLCFEVGVLLNGMFTGIIWNYMTWFLLSIGGNKLVIGLVQTIQNFIGEVPAFYFSGWLIKKLGHFNLVSLALICHGVRFFCYSYLHNPWWILPVECLHGLTFASFYAAMTSFAKLSSKTGAEATTQSILCITFDALGCGLGCLITGVCLEYFGGHTTFFYVSFLCVIATLINLLSTFILKFRKGSQNVTNLNKSNERY